MGKPSREKGKRGEREVRDLFRQAGYDTAVRGQQYCGANGDADVIGVPLLHIEVKRTEKFRLEDAMEQSRSDARDNEVPVVFHKKNNRPWVVIMDADDFMNMYREWEAGHDREN